VRLLKAFNLPTSLSDPVVLTAMQSAGMSQLGVDELMLRMAVDKKNQGRQKRMVLLRAIGKTVEPKASVVEDDVIRLAIAPSVLVNFCPSLNKNEESPVEVNVPGSKSISNRALILAALGEGECRVKGLLHSDDTQ
jgi:pentafunctional AROM polypeptide